MEEKKRPSELLSEMLNLTEQTTEQIATAQNTPLELAKYLETSRRVQSYCSITQLLTPGDPLLQESFNVAMYWRADISKTDFHVTQKMFDPERSKWLHDSWICKDSKAWRTMPFWVKFDRDELDPVNQVLTTALVLDVAKDAISTGIVRSKEGLNYVLFEFDLPQSEVNPWSPLWCTVCLESLIRLWFTLEKRQLVKMEAGPFNISDGQGVGLLDQVFACHDERIKIRGPRWINAKPTGNGQYRILGTPYMDVVTHYGEEPEPPEIHMEEDAENLAGNKDAEFGSEETYVSEFLQSYYRSPKPEDEIVPFLRVVAAGGYLNDLYVQKTFAPFMAVIFSRHPHRAEEWASEIKNERVLTRVIELSNSIDVLIDDPPSVANNDECWGAYFASGDIRFIDKLIETTRYSSSNSDPPLMFAGDTAKWSLAGNAERHMKVWGAIESAVAGGREDLQGLLTEDPEVLLARMKDAYKEIDVPDGEE